MCFMILCQGFPITTPDKGFGIDENGYYKTSFKKKTYKRNIF